MHNTLGNLIVKIICVSLGGSGVTTPHGIDQNKVRKFVQVLKDNKQYRFVVVVGGGKPARLYMDSVRHNKVTDEFLDTIGVQFTRLNAFAVRELAAQSLDVYPTVVKTVKQVKSAIKKHKVVFMGGLDTTGITTDTVTALACESINSKTLINLSSEAYVYDRPPKEPGAKRLKSLSYDQLISLANKFGRQRPGVNFIFDITASKIVKRAKIEVRFASFSPKSFANALGGAGAGTTVK